MPNELFFKTTSTYHEFIILDYIDKYSNMTQRELAKILKISPARVNLQINKFVVDKKVTRIHHNSKNVEYKITKKGLRRKRQLNMMYLHASQSIYDEARANVFSFIEDVISTGFKNIMMYGAGEVATLLVSVINRNYENDLNIIAIIDDDQLKAGAIFINIPIISLRDINEFNYDGLVIASHNHHDDMIINLKQINFDENKIITFF
jgi:DNA-binding MarR family transcriptional regulator